MNWLKQQAANIAGTAEPIYGPSALQSVAKQAETTPYTELKKDDLKWTVMDSTNVETQVFYFFADSGHIGMAQVIYSNVASIRTTAQFNLKIQYPDKSPHLWSANGLENYGFDSTKTCFYADSVAVDLSEDGSYYTIKSAVNENSIVNLKVTRAAPGFQAGIDGKSYFGTDPNNPWGSMRHAFWPRAKAEGTVVTKKGNVDFTGKAMFIHALQGMKPHHAAARWNFVNFQTPTYSAVMMEYITPPSYGSSVVNVGGIAIDGEILTAGCTNSAKATKTRQDPDWPEPSAMEFKWAGKTKDGKKITAELSGDLGERLDKVDVMAEVPGFVKSIIGGVAGTRPFIFQYGPQDWELKIQIEGEEPKVEKGKYFGESTFISE